MVIPVWIEVVVVFVISGLLTIPIYLVLNRKYSSQTIKVPYIPMGISLKDAFAGYKNATIEQKTFYVHEILRLAVREAQNPQDAYFLTQVFNTLLMNNADRALPILVLLTTNKGPEFVNKVDVLLSNTNSKAFHKELGW